MDKEAMGRLILEASTGMHGDVAKQLSDAWAEMASEVQRLQALSVTRIMIAVVPGEDGTGEEVYAQSVGEVENLLTKLDEKVEELTTVLGKARNGLLWYQDRHPESVDGSDDEAMASINAALGK